VYTVVEVVYTSLAAKMKRKWLKNTKDKGDELVTAIKEVTVNPFELAAAQNEVRIAKLKEIESIWPEIMKKIPVSLWKEMEEKAGKDNYNRSVEAKAVKQAAFADAFAPVLEEAKKKAAAMPGKTLAERLKRVETVATTLVAQKGKWRK
jgi:uncharacterized Zn finger protein